MNSIPQYRLGLIWARVKLVIVVGGLIYVSVYIKEWLTSTVVFIYVCTALAGAVVLYTWGLRKWWAGENALSVGGVIMVPKRVRQAPSKHVMSTPSASSNTQIQAFTATQDANDDLSLEDTSAFDEP